jgi:hypothetical protein
MLFDSLLPEIHFFALARFGLFGLTGLITMRATLGHTSVKGRGRVVNMPPMTFAAHIAAVVGHGLQIKAGPQALGGNRLRNDTAITFIKNAVARYRGWLVPKAPHPFKVTQ